MNVCSYSKVHASWMNWLSRLGIFFSQYFFSFKTRRTLLKADNTKTKATSNQDTEVERNDLPQLLNYGLFEETIVFYLFSALLYPPKIITTNYKKGG